MNVPGVEQPDDGGPVHLSVTCPGCEEVFKYKILSRATVAKRRWNAGLVGISGMTLFLSGLIVRAMWGWDMTQAPNWVTEYFVFTAFLGLGVGVNALGYFAYGLSGVRPASVLEGFGIHRAEMANPEPDDVLDDRRRT
ncbi:hypothetical protein [Salininema proteolyticum]|uniref:Uncharacterized protein n=1 Tax=Salininema proteolyticum TaxID=1607685 RepID=A0ABV8U4F8_9ACTN